MASPNIASTGIVLEALTKDNYDNWSTLVKNYLVGKGLWDGIIKFVPAIQDGIIEDWIPRNAKALHVIQLACGSENLSIIREFQNARDAWMHLWMQFSEDEKPYHHDSQLQGAENKLHILVSKGNWDEIKKYMDKLGDDDDDELSSTSPFTGRTVLHVAVASGLEKIVKNLVNLGNQRLLEIQDNMGYTALALAAELADNKSIAEWMIAKGGNSMLRIKTNEGEVPVLIAAAKGHKQMTRYLFSNTFAQDLFAGEGVAAAAMLLTRCIYAEIFDVAASLLHQHFFRLSISVYNDIVVGKELQQSIKALADMPHVFRSGTKFGWWSGFIYYVLRPQTPSYPNEFIINIDQSEEEDDTDTYTLEYLPSTHRLLHRLLRAVSVLKRHFKHVIQSSVLQLLPGIEKIYQMKLNHHLVLEILHWMSITAPRFDISSPYMYSVKDSMLQAAKYGIVEFINSMRNVNPNRLQAMDKNGKGLISYAICYRQEEVFQLILGIQGQKKMIASQRDYFGNNLLHDAAELGPSSYLSRMSNPALQMQRELQWFKVVEKIVPPSYKEAKNNNGMTPIELFAKNHEELMKSGEQWARDTASSFTLVGTLIITIMFAAAITVPGGNDQNTGIPMFLKRLEFQVFIIADTISLIMSSSSVLIFSEILTSRYAMQDFTKGLQYKILLGLFTLFFSVTSMMITFVAALSMMLKDHHRVVIAALSLAIIPVLVLVRTLISLTYEIFHSTWIWPNTILPRKRKSQD